MPTEILPSIHQIVLPTPFPVGPVNCYLSCQSPITLVDTGTRWEDSKTVLCSELKTLGLGLQDIERLIITHPHPDHFGLAADIRRVSGAEVWSHRLNATLLSPTEETRRERQTFYRELLNSAGFPPEQVQQFLDARTESSPYTEPVHVDRKLAEGDLIDFGGHEWIVYHTPGHSGGLICLYSIELRVLLANDHLLQSISSNPVVEPDPEGGPRPHRLVQYMFHLQRMADLNPAIAWTGHGAAIADVQKVVRQRLRFHQRRANYILDMISQQELSAHEVALAIFGTRSGFDSFLALSETIGHLDWLEMQGKAQSIERDRVVYWRSQGQQTSASGLTKSVV